MSRIKEVSRTLRLLTGADVLVTETDQSRRDAGPGPVPGTTGVLPRTTTTTRVPVIGRGLPQEKGGPIVDGITAILEVGAEVGA